MQLDLVPLWTAILALAVFMYVLLDGFDLGVGMLFGLRRDAHGQVRHDRAFLRRIDQLRHARGDVVVIAHVTFDPTARIPERGDGEQHILNRRRVILHVIRLSAEARPDF